jgi:hypothetical protein
VFIYLALRSAIGIATAGPLDPRLLAQSPSYLADDDEFELDMLPFVAEAFDQCLNGQEGRWRLFRRSLWVLALAVGCLASAFTTSVLAPSPFQGMTTMSDKDSKAPVKAPKPSAPDTTKKPTLGPYTVSKGMTIPNDPKGGTFHRGATKK